MKVKIKFFMKNGTVLLDESILFVNKDGNVCQATERGDSVFFVVRPDISYSVIRCK